jgi:hypothetical protein
MRADWKIPEWELRAALEVAGFTTTPSPLHTARDIEGDRDIGSAHVHAAIDAAGRARITIRRIAGEAKLPALHIGDASFTRVRVTEEVTTITGQINTRADLEAVLVTLKLDR